MYYYSSRYLGFYLQLGTCYLHMATLRSGTQPLVIIVLVARLILVTMPSTAGEDKEIDVLSFTEDCLIRGDWEFNVIVMGNVSNGTITIDGASAHSNHVNGPSGALPLP